MRLPRSRRGRLVLAYAVLLLASTVVRATRPSPPVPSGREHVTVTATGAGGALPEDGELPVSVGYLSWSPEASAAPNPASPGSDEVVLLLHGSPGSARAMSGLGAILGDRRRVIAPDMPGFGASTRDIPDYSIAAHAAMMNQLLDSLGVARVHLLGFSMGGGVALEMIDERPSRVASLTLLSAIGAQEFEFLGDYHINRAIHGLQLYAFKFALDWTPHFGLFDDFGLDIPYARNFYDTDQRPLRGILESLDIPALILHGSTDPLVPIEAANEHARIMPQAELVVFEDNHFMAFARPDRLATPLEDFLDRVDEGSAITRGTAPPDRQIAAARRFDPASRPVASGFALSVALFLMALAAFAAQNLAPLAGGLLVAYGSLPLQPVVVACVIGVWSCDLVRYAAGRLRGEAVLKRAPARWFVDAGAIRSAATGLTRGPWRTIAMARALPDARRVTFTIAGARRVFFPGFALLTLATAVGWVGVVTWLALGLGRLLGPESFSHLVFAFVLAALLLWGVRTALHLSTDDGRGKWTQRLGRARRWEFWPPWVFYVPLIGYVLWLVVKYRSPTLFTLVNPSIPDQGFVGESKADLLEALVGNERLARFSEIAATDGAEARREVARRILEDSNPAFPVVLKPDVGERGAGVKILHDAEALDAALKTLDRDSLIQEYVPGEELGLFWIRHPSETEGSIFSITRKVLPRLTGDGVRSVSELVRTHPRFRYQASLFLSRADLDPDLVLPDGETLTLSELGNHCRGAEFRNGGDLETPEMHRALSELATALGEFHFGRFDVRGASFEAIQQGDFKVVEVNGSASEATHIYDPDNRLSDAYRTLFEQWRRAFEIGDALRTKGHRPVSLFAFVANILRHMGPGGARWG